jgi:hypothetical protein
LGGRVADAWLSTFRSGPGTFKRHPIDDFASQAVRSSGNPPDGVLIISATPLAGKKIPPHVAAKRSREGKPAGIAKLNNL